MALDDPSSHDVAPYVVIGAGPAGLTAAYELVGRGEPVVVVEADDVVGGISRTVERDGWRFDLGGHRFFTKVRAVEDLWHEILPDEDFLMRPRMSRIYYEGKYYDYPLRAFNALKNVGVVEAVRCVGSYAWAKARPPKDQTNYENWLVARFGWRLYRRFFKTYTEKVWGVPVRDMPADWAAQRVKSLSLGKAIANALLPRRNQKEITSLIEEFQYPKYGPGMMWERCRDLVVERGGEVLLSERVVGVHATDGVVDAVTTASSDGSTTRRDAAAVISTMPMHDLVAAIDPPVPDDVRAAGEALHYRDFLTVALVVPQAASFPDNWIYIHAEDVKVGRIQNFGSWSPYLVKDGTACLGLEYFVFEGDEVWEMADDDLISMASKELESLGLVAAADVERGFVVRVPKAYPYYDTEYRSNVARIVAYLDEHVQRPPPHRAQRDAPVQQSGPLHVHRDADGREPLWRAPRHLVGERRGGVPRGVARHGWRDRARRTGAAATGRHEVSRRAALRSWREPTALFGVALLGSAAAWGRLWVTSPATRGVCGCGDPSLFQWFLAWPAHALTSGHSPVFSRALFHPEGINLLANTSVLALGVPLSPVTWLGGPVLTENVALLLAIPVAVLGMDLFLRRVTTSLVARVVLSLLYGFSPYVVASLAISHLMTAWIGLLPLIALGVVDAVGEDPRRARRGQVLLGAALVVQFFVSTELLLLAALVVVIVLAVLGVTALVQRGVPAAARRAVRRLVVPLGVAVAVLVVPAAYALWGPRSLKGNIWGPAFNPDTGGSSFLDLIRPNVVGARLSALSGYSAPVVQLQLLGWGLLLGTLAVAVWRWRDGVVRAAAITCGACVVLSLSPRYVTWAPWQWIGKLPILQNVLQFRITVFALLAAIVVLARGVEALERRGRVGVACGAVVLAIAVLPVAVPVAQSLPVRTVHVTIPSWWRAAEGPGVVLAYPFPSPVYQSPLTWQAHGAFAVSMLGGSGPQGTLSRAGDDAAATAVLVDLTSKVRGRPTATASNAALVRAMARRDGVTEVVVPVTLHGRPITTGAPSAGAAVFFTEVLGEAPVVRNDAWVFAVTADLPVPHLVTRTRAAACTALATRAGPAALGPCVLTGAGA